jgi:hypothetical protein
LYLADNGAAQIFVVNSAHIPTSGGMEVPRLSSNANPTFASIDGPWGLVFDTAGDLVLERGHYSGPLVVEFVASSLTASGTPAPAIQLTPLMTRVGVTIADPQGVSFNNLGDLVVSDDANKSTAIFKAGQLTGSGAVNPGTFLIGSATTLNAPTGLIFGPNFRRRPR